MMNILAYSGLIVPPAVWAVMMQLGQILPYADCRNHSASTLWLSIAAGLVALAAAGVSRHAATSLATRYGLFLGNLGFLMGLAFFFALLLQGAAAALIDPCLR
jgi:hypothetical protein